MKQKLVKHSREIDKSTIAVGDVNIPLLKIYGTTGQKISKDVKFNTTINQNDLIDI